MLLTLACHKLSPVLEPPLKRDVLYGRPPTLAFTCSSSSRRQLLSL